MTLRKIYEQLEMEPKYDEEISKLNSRIPLMLDEFREKFHESQYLDKTIYPKLVKEFALLIGEDNIYQKALTGRYYLPLSDFFEKGNDEDTLHRNIRNLSILLEVSKRTLTQSFHVDLYRYILVSSKRAFELALVDIGYLFIQESIVKKRARELDENLILGNLSWLSSFPNVRQIFANSLRHFLAKEYPDAITDAYSSLESLVKTFLGRDMSLDDNETRADLMKQLGLGQDWGQMSDFYSKLAHEFSSRYGKKETGESSQIATELAEFYIYMTGSFVRLIGQIIQNRDESNAG